MMTTKQALRALIDKLERRSKDADKKAGRCKAQGHDTSFTRYDERANTYFQAMCLVEDILHDLENEEFAT